MRQLWMITFAVLLAINVSACSPDNSPETPEIPETEQSDDNSNGNEEGERDMKLIMTVGTATFTATLADNETAKAFKAMLPMTINMRDVNSNEKFFTLPQNLPNVAVNPGTIHSGDLMLYGASGLVLFYKTFSTSYSYTRIGSIDNPSELERILGTGSVTVLFEKIN